LPTGITTTGVLADSLDDIRSSARVIREYGPVMARLVDTTRLKDGIGLDWKEVFLNKITAMNIDELTDLEQSPQEIVDGVFSIRPTAVGLSMFVTDRTKRRINPLVAAKMGVLAENAMSRKKDIDLIAIAQTFTVDLGTAGQPMESGFVSAAVSRIANNTTEPWDGPTATVLHGFQKKDIQDEIVAGIGTYTVPVGLSQDVFLKGFSGGTLYDSSLWVDGNIPVDASDDAIGFTFASGANGAIVHVEGMESRMITERKENIGTGAEIMYATDEYGTGIRQNAWGFTYTTDATAPVN
jgi:hypothetical protein